MITMVLLRYGLSWKVMLHVQRFWYELQLQHIFFFGTDSAFWHYCKYMKPIFFFCKPYFRIITRGNDRNHGWLQLDAFQFFIDLLPISQYAQSIAYRRLFQICLWFYWWQLSPFAPLYWFKPNKILFLYSFKDELHDVGTQCKICTWYLHNSSAVYLRKGYPLPRSSNSTGNCVWEINANK